MIDALYIVADEETITDGRGSGKATKNNGFNASKELSDYDIPEYMY